MKFNGVWVMQFPSLVFIIIYGYYYLRVGKNILVGNTYLPLFLALIYAEF